MKIIPKLLIALATVSAISANAALYDRGNGMIYDSSQNITWLQDANYAKTSGYDEGGQTWYEASDWANNLIYGGFSDWRLPSARLIGSNSFSYDGSTDYSYNNTRSELGHLFFELGNKSYYNTSGVSQLDYGWLNSSFADELTSQSIAFFNVKNADWYWEAESYSQNMSYAWAFSASSGRQSSGSKNNPLYAWAVRDGDVVPVPVPAAAWLMGSGLIGLAGIARRKK